MHESEKISVRIVKDWNAREAIYRLRYEQYLKKGYVSPHPKAMKSDMWDEIPETIQFGAFKGDALVGSIRLVFDSEKGLPMEQPFPEEIARLRLRAENIAEASTLVVADSEKNSCQKIWLMLSRAIWQEAKRQNIDYLCIAVTENHLCFYKRLLFEPTGAGRHYDSLNRVFAYPLAVRIADVLNYKSSEAEPCDSCFLPTFLQTK